MVIMEKFTLTFSKKILPLEGHFLSYIMFGLTKINLIIHSFALAHAVVILAFKWLGWPNDIPLTILTIATVMWVSMEQRIPIDIAAAIALLCCFAGFFLGTQAPKWIENTGVKWLMDYSNVVTTVVVTELLGWMTFFITRRRKQ